MFYILPTATMCIMQDRLSGPEFTKPTDALPQDIAQSRSRKIRV